MSNRAEPVCVCFRSNAYAAAGYTCVTVDGKAGHKGSPLHTLGGASTSRPEVSRANAFVTLARSLADNVVEPHSHLNDQEAVDAVTRLEVQCHSTCIDQYLRLLTSTASTTDPNLASTAARVQPLLVGGTPIRGETAFVMHEALGGRGHGVNADVRRLKRLVKDLVTELGTGFAYVTEGKTLVMFCEAAVAKMLWQLSEYQEDDGYDVEDDTTGAAAAPRDVSVCTAAARGLGHKMRGCYPLRMLEQCPPDPVTYLTNKRAEDYCTPAVMAFFQLLATCHLPQPREGDLPHYSRPASLAAQAMVWEVNSRRLVKSGPALLKAGLIPAEDFPEGSAIVEPPHIHAIGNSVRLLHGGAATLQDILRSFGVSAGADSARTVCHTYAARELDGIDHMTAAASAFEPGVFLHASTDNIDFKSSATMGGTGRHDGVIGLYGRAPFRLQLADVHLAAQAVTATRTYKAHPPTKAAPQAAVGVNGVVMVGKPAVPHVHAVAAHPSLVGLNCAGLSELGFDVDVWLDTSVDMFKRCPEFKYETLGVHLSQATRAAMPVGDPRLNIHHKMVAGPPGLGKFTSPATCLRIAQRYRNALDDRGQASGILAADCGGFLVLAKVIWGEARLKRTMILEPGHLHTDGKNQEMLFGKFGRNSGMREWWTAAGVVAEATADRIAGGKDTNAGRVLITASFIALRTEALAAYLQANPDQVAQHNTICQLRDEHKVKHGQLAATLPESLRSLIKKEQREVSGWLAGLGRDRAQVKYWLMIMELMRLQNLFYVNMRVPHHTGATIAARHRLGVQLCYWYHLLNCPQCALMWAAHLSQLAQLYMTMPDAWAQYENGELGFMHLGGARVGADHAAESCLVKKTKQAVGNLAGSTHSDSQFQALLLASPESTLFQECVNVQLLDKPGPTVGRATTFTKPEEAIAVRKLLVTLGRMVPLFKPASGDDTDRVVSNLVTGKQASAASAAAVSDPDLIDKGRAMHEEMMSRIQSPNGVSAEGKGCWDTMLSGKIKGLVYVNASTGKAATNSTKQLGETMRKYVVNREREHERGNGVTISLKQLLAYPLVANPPTMTNDDKSPVLEKNKSALGLIVKEKSTPYAPALAAAQANLGGVPESAKRTTLLLDGGMMLVTSATVCADVGSAVTHLLERMMRLSGDRLINAKSIYFVGETYGDPKRSFKAFTDMQRSKDCPVYTELHASTKLGVRGDAFLGSVDNKRLINQHARASVLSAEHSPAWTAFINDGGSLCWLYGEDCHRLVSSPNGSLAWVSCPELEGYLPEADQKLLAVAVKVNADTNTQSAGADAGWQVEHDDAVAVRWARAGCQAVTQRPTEGILLIFTEDTDNLLGLISLTPRLQGLFLGVLYGKSHNMSGMVVHSVVDSLGTNLAILLEALHHLSGNDYIPKTRLQGKKRWYAALLEEYERDPTGEIIAALRELGENDYTPDDISTDEYQKLCVPLRTFYLRLLKLWGAVGVADLNDARCHGIKLTSKPLDQLTLTNIQWEWHVLHANTTVWAARQAARDSGPQAMPDPLTHGWCFNESSKAMELGWGDPDQVLVPPGLADRGCKCNLKEGTLKVGTSVTVQNKAGGGTYLGKVIASSRTEVTVQRTIGDNEVILRSDKRVSNTAPMTCCTTLHCRCRNPKKGGSAVSCTSFCGCMHAACKNKIVYSSAPPGENVASSSSSSGIAPGSSSANVDDHQGDAIGGLECGVCGGGDIGDADGVLCDGPCDKAFHLRCVDLAAISEDDWFCTHCAKALAPAGTVDTENDEEGDGDLDEDADADGGIDFDPGPGTAQVPDHMAHHTVSHPLAKGDRLATFDSLTHKWFVGKLVKETTITTEPVYSLVYDGDTAWGLGVQTHDFPMEDYGTAWVMLSREAQLSHQPGGRRRTARPVFDC